MEQIVIRRKDSEWVGEASGLTAAVLLKRFGSDRIGEHVAGGARLQQLAIQAKLNQVELVLEED